MQLSRSAGDHCNPVVAIDSVGVLYAAWQEHARGTWNIRLSVSADGLQWSEPTMITDSNDNQMNPALAAGVLPSGLVALTWQGGPMGNQDVYVATSTDAFATAGLFQVTTDPTDQIEPAVAIDAEGTVVVLWTDARNTSSDIYGAASDRGPWANVPVVDIDSNQSQVAVAAGPAGLLHVAWVDDIGGDRDVFYAVSEGLPVVPLAGVDLIDDAARADQHSPTLAATVGADGTDRVFACWADARNGNADLYLADVTAGAPRTNVRVTDGLVGNRTEPALAMNLMGNASLAWTDDATGVGQVYCSEIATFGYAPVAEGSAEPPIDSSQT